MNKIYDFSSEGQSKRLHFSDVYFPEDKLLMSKADTTAAKPFLASFL